MNSNVKNEKVSVKMTKKTKSTKSVFDILSTDLGLKEPGDNNNVVDDTITKDLLNDADEGGDKIGEKAKALQLEPMEVAHFYTKKYHDSMRKLNVDDASIEPLASGHIIEQIEMIKKIINNCNYYSTTIINPSQHLFAPSSIRVVFFQQGDQEVWRKKN